MSPSLIPSLLDTDLYKFTMMQAMWHQHRNRWAKYVLKCRNRELVGVPLYIKLKEEIDILCTLRFSTEEIRYLGTLGYFQQDFLDFLKGFQLDRKYIHIEIDTADRISIWAEGPLCLVSPFEVPVLSLVNECVAITTGHPRTILGLEGQVGDTVLEKKIQYLQTHPFSLAEFGTRRRFSQFWQEKVVDNLSSAVGTFAGTSNVYLARKYRLKPIGTMAHEWVQLYQAVVHPLDSQRAALQGWADEYRGALGIALSDTLGFKKFLVDFDPYFAKLYDGVRHDSGDPVDWGNRMIAHYNKFGIDPTSKQLVFSDGLTEERGYELEQRFGNYAIVRPCIGTKLTNDFPEFPALQVVMKLVRVDGRPVAKISDSLGKGMCEDAQYQGWLQEACK